MQNRNEHVRMAEWSKAPDSSFCFPYLGFLVSVGGVGSNPTSDMVFFCSAAQILQLLLVNHSHFLRLHCQILPITTDISPFLQFSSVAPVRSDSATP